MMALNNGSLGLYLQVLGPLFLLLALNYRVSEALNSEGEVLQAFKLRLEDPVGALSNWNDSDATPCKWEGIVCNNVTEVVSFINLPFSNLTGSLAPQLSGLKHLEGLSLQNNDFCGRIPDTFSNFTSLRVLNLRNNSIAGSIPATIGTMKNLQVLDLANNMLDGSIPESFSNLTSLYYMDLSNNQLSGKVPEGALLRFNISSYLGNANLCGLASVGLPSCSPLPAFAPSLSPVRRRKSALSLVQIVLLSVGLFLGLKFIIAVILILRWMRKDNHMEIKIGAGGKIVMFQGDRVNVPTSKEMLRALRLIRKQHIIGEGGFGVVYKLQVNDHPPLAVKKLKTSLESERSFENELDTLGSVKHRNLVKLKGFYSAPNVKLLIYDFLPGGNLDQLLRSEKEGNVVIDWPIRYRIALGLARGLAYLHHGCNPRIIHGDVSATNVLLDADFQPYLSDFGLAKLLNTTDTHVTVTVGGTFGYVAPEFAKSGKATEKVDVYSYGVILLELLSGRRAVDESMPDGYTNLAGWVRDLHSTVHGDAVAEVVDKNLRDTVPGVELDLLLEVACHCISLNSQDRPQMTKVMETLEILSETETTPSGTSTVRTSHDTPDGSITACHFLPNFV